MVPLQALNPLSDELDILLPFLEHDRSIAQLVHNEERWIKFGSKQDEQVTITEADKCIVSLKYADRVLENREETLAVKLKGYDNLLYRNLT